MHLLRKNKKIKSAQVSFSWWRKALAVFCSVIILSPLAVKLPGSQASPGEGEKNLVIVFSERSLLEDSSLSQKIYRYASDVQSAVPQTRALVVPVSSEVSAGSLFAVLERMYLEGYHTQDGIYRLSGMVLIGDISLPIIRSAAVDGSSVFPLTDFEDPAFLWDEVSQVFRLNESHSELQAEIFHGVIRAPGSEEKNESQWLSDFFDKNHRFHSGEFSAADQELLFADLIGEAAGIHPLRQDMYEAGHDHFQSDLAFLRYNQSLLADVNLLHEQFTADAFQLSDLPEDIKKKLDDLQQDMVDFPLPDSFAYQRIKQLLPEYVQVVEGYLSKALPKIMGTGRWMVKEDTADTIPELITRMDVMSREFIREFSVQQENKIIDFVENHWQKPVYVLEKIYNKNYDRDDFDGFFGGSDEYFYAYYHGLLGEKVEKAEQCSLYRGSKTSDPREFGEHSQFTEMNHLWNRYPEDSLGVYERQCSIYGKCCIMYSESPEECNPDGAQKDVFDYQGGKIDNTDEDISFLDCAFGSTAERFVDSRTNDDDFNILPIRRSSKKLLWQRYLEEWELYYLHTHPVSSLIVHNEPRPETISKAIEKGISGAIPADENRRVQFQSQSGDVISIDFPDLFALTDNSYFSGIDEFQAAAETLYFEKKEEMRKNMLLSNIESYVYNSNFDITTFTIKGTRLFFESDPGRPPLEKQVSDFYTGATQAIRNAIAPDSEPISDMDAWMRYIEAIKSDDQGGLGIDEKIREIAAGALGIDEEQILPFETFVRTGGIYARYIPPCNPDDEFCFGNYILRGDYKEYIEKCEEDDGVCYEDFLTITFPFLDISELDFLFGEDTLDIESDAEGVLPYYLEWQTLSQDQKHKRVFELFWGEDLQRHPLGGPKTSYEYAAIRASGDADGIWWQKKDFLYLPGDDPEWENALEERQNEEEDGDDDGEEEDEDIDSCTGKKYGDGVSILEWLPAFQCWLQDTLEKPVEIEMSNACSYANTLSFDNEESYDDIISPDLADIPAGSEIHLFSAKGVQVPEGTETDIKIEFQRPDGNLITGGVAFEVIAKDGARLLGSDQEFSEITYTGEFTFPVRVESAPASVQVVADGFAKRTLYFEPFTGGYIELEERQLPDLMDRELSVTLKGSRGQVLTNYSGTAYATVADPSLAEVSESRIVVKNGVGKTVIRQIVSVPIDVSVSLTGFSPVSITLFENQLGIEADRLLLYGVPEALALREEAAVTIMALDNNGNYVFAPSNVDVHVTEKTKDILEIVPLGGEGEFLLRAKEKVGTARIIAEHPTLLTGLAEVQVVDKIRKEDIRSLQPNSLVTSLLGSDYANFSQSDDPIANTILFSGRSQAVISSIHGGVTESPGISVNKDGSARVFASGITVFPSSLSPLKIRIYDTLRSASLAEFALSYPGGTSLTVLSEEEPSEETEGIFFENFDESESLTAEVENDMITVSYLDAPVVTVTDEGAFEVLDNRFSLNYEANEEITGLQLVFEENATVGHFALLGVTMTPFQYPIDRTTFFPVMGNEDGSLGFFISGDSEGLLLPSGGKAMEQASDIFAVGFNEDDNFALQLAAGSTAGDAAKFAFGPSGILLGDPTVSFAKDQKIIAGFDRSTGEEVTRKFIQRNDFVIPFDADGDELPDILIATKRGEVRLMKNLGDLQFRDTGEYLEHTSGIEGIAALGVDGDLLDDILILEKDGSLAAYKNRDEYLEPYTDISFPNVSLQTIQTADFDADGLSDILGYDDAGVVSVFWGSASGYSDDRKTIVGSYGAKVDGGNLAINNTMVSMPNISSRVSEVYPLLLGKSVGEKDGVETVAEYLEESTSSAQDTGEDVWNMLSGLNEEFPDSFSQDFSTTPPSEGVRAGIFATLSDVSDLTVSLTAKDENGGVLQKDDDVAFTLRVKNETNNNLHFALAHVLNPAFQINNGNITVSDSWPENRDVPRIRSFGSDGTVYILNVRLYPGESQDMTFTATMRESSPAKMIIRKDLDFLPDHPADGLPDITVLVPGVNGLLHYLSKPQRAFAKYFEPNGEVEIPDFLKDENGNEVPDKYEEDKDNDGLPDYSENAFEDYGDDTDGDGIPDIWDETIGDSTKAGSTLGGLGEIADNVMKYTQCRGGCLNIPINFAFLVPGKINIFNQIFGSVQQGRHGSSGSGGLSESVKNFSPGIASAMNSFGSAINGVSQKMKDFVKNLGIVQKGKGVFAGVLNFGVPVFGTLKDPPFVCSGPTCNVATSLFRIYVSPTLTGGVGIGICVGQFIPGDGVAIGAVDTAKCMAFAPPVLNLCGYDGFSGKDKDFDFVVDYGTDNCSIVNGNSDSDAAKEKGASGLAGLLFQLDELGEFSLSFDTGKNKRVMAFPWNWVYKQMAEFYAMLTTMPSITVYYPDFSAFSLDRIQDSASEALNKTSMFGDKIQKGVSSLSLKSISEQIVDEAKKVFRPLDSGENGVMTDEEKDELLRKYKKEDFAFREKANEAFGSIDELYEAFSAIPLVTLEPSDVFIKVPYISRSHIFALRREMDAWVKDAEEEIAAAKEAWSSCPSDASPEEKQDCAAIKVVTDKITIEADKLLITAKRNIQMLDKYLTLDDLIADIDNSISQWLSQVICILDTSVLSLSSWFIKNKRRLEMWIELYYLMDAFREIFDSLKDIFVDYENYCPFCASDRGESHGGIFDIVFDMDLSPPIIRFPRLPDIVIDLSQIKGGITLPVPRPQFHFVSLIYPKIDRLDLMGPPLWEIYLPGIPLLPDLPTISAIPAFPPTPIITLPDLPPAPRLPDFPAAIADVISLAKPIMYLYCLFNKMGSLPVGEDIGLKALIEGLTARPTNKMFSFDFAGALFEDIVIPSVRRIDIALEVNLDFMLGDGLVGVFQDMFDPWNDMVTDLRKETKDIQSNLNYTIKNIGGANVDLDRDIDLEDIFSSLPLEIQLLLEFKKEYASVFQQYLSEDQPHYTAAELRSKMGYDPVRLADEFPAIQQIQDLRQSVVALQKEYKKESNRILALNDVTKFEGDFVAESALASKIYTTSVSAELPEHTASEASARALVDVSVVYPDEVVSDNETFSFTDALQTFSNSTVGVADEEIIQRDGFYAQCTDANGDVFSQQVITNDDFLNGLKTMFLRDLDGDGDEEMVLATNYSLYIKENHTKMHMPEYITDAPLTADIQDLLPISEAVKNVIVRSGEKNVRVGFSANFDDELLGIKIVIRNQKEDFFLPDGQSENGEHLVVLLLPTRYVPEENDHRRFSKQEVLVEDMLFSGTILVREFTSEYVRIPLPADRQWFIRLHEIRPEGLSTGSEIRLTSTEKGEDIFSPVMVGDTYKEMMLFEELNLTMPVTDIGTNAQENTQEAIEVLPQSTFPQEIHNPNKGQESDFSASIIWPEQDILLEEEGEDEEYQGPPENNIGKSTPADAESAVKLEWDSDGDGIFESTGENITFLPATPGEHTITVRATDSSGNFSEEKVFVNVKVPKVILEKEKLSEGIVSGNVNPRIGGVPLVILRERAGKLKKLITGSAEENGKYFTDINGNYSVNDFLYTPGAVLRNTRGEELAQIDASTGKIKISSSEVDIVSTSSGKSAAIYRDNGRVLAEVVSVADGNTDVEILASEITAKNATDFLPGVYLADRNVKDVLVFGNIPGDAPFFPGGAAVYDEEKTIALFSVFGEPKIVSDGYTFQVKATDNSEKPIILQLVDKYGTPRFDFFVQSAGKAIYLAEDSEPKHKFYQYPIFSDPPQDTKEAVSLLPENNRNDGVFALFSLPGSVAEEIFANLFWQAEMLFSSGEKDLCLDVPEDLDGVDDADGCPEYDFEVQFDDLQSGIYLASGYSDSPTPLLDFWADIRPGDRIATAITAPDDSVIYSQSDFISIPERI